MAQFTLDPGTVSHTLPTTFWGCYAGIYFNQDGLNLAFQQLAKDLQPEVWNFVSQNPTMNAAAAPWVNYKALALALANADSRVVQNIQLSARPSVKNYTGSAQSAGVAANGSGFSPSDAAAIVANWVNAGIRVRSVDHYNEPSLVAIQADDGSPWFSGGTTQASYQCQDWAAIHQRDYQAAIKTQATSLGINISSHVGTTAGAEPDSYAFATANTIAGQMWGTGDTNPNSPASNVNYFDRVSIHPYCGQLGNSAGGAQGRVNRIFWDGSPVTSWGPPFPGIKTYIDGIRSYMNSNGASGKEIVVTESGADWKGGGAMWVPLVDLTYTILFAKYQSAWKLAYYLHTEFSRGFNAGGVANSFGMTDLLSGMPTGSGNEVTTTFPATGSAYEPNARYFAIRDISSPYMRNCKQQIHATTVVAPGMTPATAEGNSVPRIQFQAGLHATLNQLWIIAANLDLGASETVVWNLGFTPTASTTGVKITQTQGLDSAPVSITPIAPTGTTLTLNMGAGEAYLLRITMGAAPPTTPPPAKVATLTEDFTGAYDATKWTKSINSAAWSLTQGGGQLVASGGTAPTPSSWAEYQSVKTNLDATGSKCYIRVPNAGNQATSLYHYLQLHNNGDSNTYVGVRVQGTNATAYSVVAAAETDFTPVAWNSATMQYLRITEAAGTVTIDMGADPTSGTGWTTVTTLSTPAWWGTVQVRYGFAANAEASGFGSPSFSNLNVTAPAQATILPGVVTSTMGMFGGTLSAISQPQISPGILTSTMTAYGGTLAPASRVNILPGRIDISIVMFGPQRITGVTADPNRVTRVETFISQVKRTDLAAFANSIKWTAPANPPTQTDADRLALIELFLECQTDYNMDDFAAAIRWSPPDTVFAMSDTDRLSLIETFLHENTRITVDEFAAMINWIPPSQR